MPKLNIDIRGLDAPFLLDYNLLIRLIDLLTSMTVTVFSPDQFPTKLFNDKKVSRCTHPWDKTPVGGGFFVDGTTCKSAPSCPQRLKDRGYVFEYAKLVNDPLPGTVHSVTGYLFYRIR